LLPLSDFTLTFNKSKDFVRLCLLIHAFLLLALWYSNFSWGCSVGLLALIAYPLYEIIHTRMPHPHFQKLTFHQTYWLLHEKNNQPIEYEQLEIRMDTGIFLVIVLQSKSHSKKVILFHDQIPVETLRILKIIVKVGHKSKERTIPK